MEQKKTIIISSPEILEAKKEIFKKSYIKHSDLDEKKDKIYIIKMSSEETKKI